MICANCDALQLAVSLEKLMTAMDPIFVGVGSGDIYVVEMIPVAAGITASPAEYPWSSARAHFEGKDDMLACVSPLHAMISDWEEFFFTIVIR